MGSRRPTPIWKARRRLGRPPKSCIVVEDAPAGIASGRAAGMQVVAVTSTHSRGELDTPFVVDSLSALRTHLQFEGEPRLLVSLPA